MESVSCHQKGLVMGNILWSVDKKIYSDKEDHTLAITGWAITRNQSECDFILYGSGKELFVPEPSRCERADVAKDLKETKADNIIVDSEHNTLSLISGSDIISVINLPSEVAWSGWSD